MNLVEEDRLCCIAMAAWGALPQKQWDVVRFLTCWKNVRISGGVLQPWRPRLTTSNSIKIHRLREKGSARAFAFLSTINMHTLQSFLRR